MSRFPADRAIAELRFRPLPRLLLLADARDPGGDPRPALLIPGRPRPVIFPTIGAAVVAKRAAEGGR